MNNSPTVWITSENARDLGIRGNEFSCRILDLNELVYEILRDGSPKDIVVLPYFRNFIEVVGHIRDRGIKGPVIVYTNSEIIQMNLMNYAAQGVLFLDSSRFTKPMMTGFISFLQKQQELSSTADHSEHNPHSSVLKPPRPSQNKEEIRELFRDVLRRRAKTLLSCQFKDNLPTLTVTCEIIQIVGEIETRLVLDNFKPEEFVILYNQLGKGKPLSGFITRGDETLGFDLEVDTSRRGKITVFLPESVYEQKRKYFRVEPDPKVPVTIFIQPPDDRTISIAVRDVSEGGVGVVSSYPRLEKGTSYPAALALPKKQLIMGSATIMFKDKISGDNYTYGMALSFHPTDVQYLQHYVYKRQAGILAAIRNLTI